MPGPPGSAVPASLRTTLSPPPAADHVDQYQPAKDVAVVDREGGARSNRTRRATAVGAPRTTSSASPVLVAPFPPRSWSPPRRGRRPLTHSISFAPTRPRPPARSRERRAAAVRPGRPPTRAISVGEVDPGGLRRRPGTSPGPTGGSGRSGPAEPRGRRASSGRAPSHVDLSPRERCGCSLEVDGAADVKAVELEDAARSSRSRTGASVVSAITACSPSASAPTAAEMMLTPSSPNIVPTRPIMPGRSA